MKLENQEINTFLERVKEFKDIGLLVRVDQNNRLEISMGENGYLATVDNLSGLEAWLSGWKLGKGSVGEGFTAYMTVEDYERKPWDHLNEVKQFYVDCDELFDNTDYIKIRIIRESSW